MKELGQQSQVDQVDALKQSYPSGGQSQSPPGGSNDTTPSDANGGRSTGEIPSQAGENPGRTATPEDSAPLNHAEGGQSNGDIQPNPGSDNPSRTPVDDGTLRAQGGESTGEIPANPYRFQGYQNSNTSAPTNSALYRDGSGNQISLPVRRDPTVGYRLNSSSIPAPTRVPSSASSVARSPAASSGARPQSASPMRLTTESFGSSMPIYNPYASVPRRPARPAASRQMLDCVPGTGCTTLVY